MVKGVTSQGSDEMRTAGGACARFRAGTLFQGVPTPCYMPPTVAGTVPHVTPDNCDNLLPSLATKVVDFADVLPLLPWLKERALAPRDFLHLQNEQLVLSARDYLTHSNPPSSKSAFMVATSKGRRAVTPQEFMDAAAMLRPQLLVPLADEIASSFGNNRQRAAMRVSLEWLDACLAQQKQDDSFPDMMVCGVIVGGADERVRRMSAEETIQRDVQALLLSGLDSCVDSVQRDAMIRAVVDTLATADEDKGDDSGRALALPRLTTGIGHPVEVVSAVASGVDAFISSYPTSVTQAHGALIFWTDATIDDDNEGDAHVRSVEREASGVVLHLRESRFARDFTPLLAGCECYTCRKYTRAYVHHLLNVREMLGDTLLQIHNLHHYELLFRTIRERIQDGTFQAFATRFQERFHEKPSTAAPVAVPLAISERQEQKDVERIQKREQRVALAAKAAARAKAEAEAAKTGAPCAS